MEKLSLVFGISGVVLFLLSYQQKERKRIIIVNAVSRALYIIQYLLLAAFEGAVLDAAGLLSSVLASQREHPFVKRHLRLYITAVNIFVILCGAAVYKNPCSILPAIGVLCHTGALWIKKERIIRLLSLAGSPFWLAYNIICHAYGSAIGDALTIISILTAIYRYDIKQLREK